MKKQTFIIIAVFAFSTNAFSQATTDLNRNFEQQKNQSIVFTENKGQVHDQDYAPHPDVLYGVIAGNMAVHIKNNGISYQLNRVDAWKETEDKFGHASRKEVDKQTIYRIDLNWLDHNSNFTKSEDETLPGFNNYYLENCPNGALYVKSYKGVTLHNLYNGVDLHYYEKNGELKHDYIVAPRAGFKQIQIEVLGADISLNSDGSLILNTPLGKVQEGAPLVYQNGKKLKAGWQVKKNILSFDIENYDPALELIIDPVTRLWSTYYGGTNNDNGYGCATDASNNVYMVGFTGSTTGTLIATAGSHQSSNGGGGDCFLVKFNSAGVRQWGTYYGGTGPDYAASCVADATGNVYITGQAGASAAGVIASPGSHQTVYGGVSDAFLAKFNSSGVRQWATYYGGAGDEVASFCTTDASGNVYMTGITTTSTNTSAIATPGCHQPAWGGGNSYDAFLVKFNGSGVRLWGTYYGGNFDDKGESCATDAAGNVYMAGYAGSNTPNAISTPGSHQPGYVGAGEGFLVKFDASGVRLWGTYYGGLGIDDARSCATDASGNVYLTGQTASTAGISTTGSHQPTFGTGSNDVFLAKFNSSGVRQWGTFYGGTGNEDVFNCKTDANGNAYFAGLTTSNVGTIIATGISHQTAFGGGTSDAMLVKFDPTGARQWGTYYGGAAADDGSGCATDGSGNVYLAGSTSSNGGNDIATPGSHQQSPFGLSESFLAKFDACNAPVQPLTINGNTIVCGGSGATTYSLAAVATASLYSWSLPPGWSGSSSSTSISATPGTSGVFTVLAINNCGSSPSQTLGVTVTDCTGLAENYKHIEAIKLYPNPTSGIIDLVLDSDKAVIIVNALGQTVYSAQLSSGDHQINLEHLVKGVYIVKVEEGKMSTNLKLIRD